MCFVNFFDSFIAVILLKLFKFKSSVLFETHTLLDKSIKILKLSKHLIYQNISILTING